MPRTSDPDILRARLGLRPQAERSHFVFLEPCGCPLGLTEERPRVRTEDQAWKDMFESRAEERQAAARGVRVEHVDHDTYVRGG